MKYLKWLLLSFLFFKNVNAQLIDLEDINKTMNIFEHAFQKKKIDYFRKISSDHFLKSNGFKSLLRDANKYFINLGYTNIKCIKEFDIENSENKLIVHFIQKNDFWYVENAFIKIKDEIRDIPTKGFKPLAVEFNFSDFINAIQTGKIADYSGIAPFGKLNASFFKKNKIQLSHKSKVLIKNIILHDSKKIKEISYLSLKNYTKLIDNKRGWLIEEYGSMNKYYKNYMEQDVFIDFLINKLELKNYDLNKKSPYIFANIKESQNSNDLITYSESSNFIKIKKIYINFYKNKLQNKFLKVLIEINNDVLINKNDINIQIKNNKLECIFNKPLKFLEGNYSYISFKTDKNILYIKSAPEHTIKFKSNAQLYKWFIRNNFKTTSIEIIIAL